MTFRPTILVECSTRIGIDTKTDTHTHRHKPSTVALTVRVCRGLISRKKKLILHTSRLFIPNAFFCHAWFYRDLCSIFYLAPLSDERAQRIIEKALESSSFNMRNVVSVITGLMGSG